MACIIECTVQKRGSSCVVLCLGSSYPHHLSVHDVELKHISLLFVHTQYSLCAICVSGFSVFLFYLSTVIGSSVFFLFLFVFGSWLWFCCYRCSQVDAPSPVLRDIIHYTHCSSSCFLIFFFIFLHFCISFSFFSLIFSLVHTRPLFFFLF